MLSHQSINQSINQSIIKLSSFSVLFLCAFFPSFSHAAEAVSYDSVTVADKLHLDANGIDAGKQKIKNLADAENDDEAVTYKQLKNYHLPYFSVSSWEGISIGHESEVYFGGIAIGYKAKGYYAVAKDPKNLACPACGDGIAIGNEAQASGFNAIAIGTRSKAGAIWDFGSIAIGVDAEAIADTGMGIALGYSAKAAHDGAIAIGQRAEGHIVIGKEAFGSLSIGEEAGKRSDRDEDGHIAATGTLIGHDTRILKGADGGIALGNSSIADKMVFGDEATKLDYYDENGVKQVFNFFGEYNEFGGRLMGALSLGGYNIPDTLSPGGRQIHALAPGRINATSTDGVNGSQLYGVITALDALRKRVEKIKMPAPTEPTAPTDSGNITAPPRNESLDDVKDEIAKVQETAQKGWRLKAAAVGGKVESDGEEKVKPGDEVIMEAGKNIVVKQKQGRVINIATGSKPTFEKVVSTGEISANGMVHANGGLTVAQNQVVNMGGNQVTNVAEGVKPTDAVNKAQLDRVAGETVRQVGRVERKIDQVDRKLRAGIAGATAIAFLQQPSVGGKSLVSMSVGGYRNQQAVAVGYGRNSDNNKVTFKVGGSVNSQGDMNWGGSVGYQW